MRQSTVLCPKKSKGDTMGRETGKNSYYYLGYSRLVVLLSLTYSCVLFS